MSRPLAFVLALVLLSACPRKSQPAAKHDAAPAAPERAGRDAAAQTPSPRRETAAAVQTPSVETSAKRAPGQPPPERGCRAVQDTVLPAPAQKVWLPPEDRGVSALVLRSDGETLEWWTDTGKALALAATRKVAAKIERLSLARKAPALYVLGWVDEHGAVFKLAYAGGAFGEPQRVAKGADRRFAPALYEREDRELLAYVATVDDAMHTFVVTGRGPPSDVTPAGHGAAAPTFTVGHGAPLLVFVDARAGVSPLLSVRFDTEGRPEPARVRTPVSQPYSPPLLRAVAVPGGDVEVAFTAVGKLAATAIGRVPLERAVDAVALHPSRGYGELSFDVAVSGRAAVFAAEVPQSSEPGAPRLIEVTWLDAKGQGETQRLSGEGGSATHPSIAASPVVGELHVAYMQGDAAHVARIVCDG